MPPSEGPQVTEHPTETAPPDAPGGPDGPPRGVTPPSTPGGRGRFVSDVIVALGFVDAATVERAVESARVTGKSVTSLLLEDGLLTEEQLARALAERHGLDYLDLHELEVDLAAANLVSRSDALRYSAVPVAFTEDGALVAAMADPADPLAIGEISVMTKLQVRPAVATPAGIESLLERLPDVEDSREGPQPAGPAASGNGATERTSNGRSSADSPGGAVVWKGHVGAPVDPLPPVPTPEAAAPANPAPVRGTATAELEELREQLSSLQETLAMERSAHGDRSAELEALRSHVRSVEGAASQRDQAQREARDLRDELKDREEELTRAREERDRLAAEREAAKEMAAAGERAELELERVTSELDSAKERASKIEEELQAALERERSERAAERGRHEGERSALREELERAQAAAIAAESLEAERERLATELEAARARADEAQRTAEESERLAEEAERALADAQRTADDAERAAGEAHRAAEESARRAAHLEDADERAERARLALADLREEREREGELFARSERELREEVTTGREALERQTAELRAARAALSETIRSMTALEVSLARATEQLPSPNVAEDPGEGRSSAPVDDLSGPRHGSSG